MASLTTSSRWVVYQVKDEVLKSSPEIMMGLQMGKQLPWHCYRRVALVETEYGKLERVWEIGQNPEEGSWVRSEGVHPSVMEARSLMVGDVVVEDSGNAYVVSGQGFREYVGR